MNKITLITGGARSGKSTFAENTIRALNKNTAYLATAVAFDEGMKNRINKHIAQRPSEWKTYEKSVRVHEIIEEINDHHEVLLLDCITVLMSNTLFEHEVDWDTVSMDQVDEIEEDVKNHMLIMVESMRKTNLEIYLVTNELGSGIVPENRLA
ncbi:MAG: bifunctional adenosylcobinamide kinase/adenosylcobinamide-phosphate guanylyltransferase, partial [Clostridia bacterium]|nr:bifunctional adenosylcobinamide kinase/adenosylcobinamide-phosphate guanylyltransferase [Clostridia bacterium]